MRYFDNNATTKMESDLAERFAKLCVEEYANPNSMHSFGLREARYLEEARRKIARSLSSDPREIYFTSCATESINWILRSSVLFKGRKKRIVTTSIEHKAVLNTLKDLKASSDIDYTTVGPERNGIVKVAKLLDEVDEETFLVSLMAVNNVTGAIQPYEEIGEELRKRNVLFHLDAVQTIGKIPIDFVSCFCDYASFSAHKFHGPKGVGVTYIRQGAPIRPLITGGGQERGMRSGTQNVPGTAIAATALQRAVECTQESSSRLREYQHRIKETVEELDGVVNTPENSISNTVNASFAGIRSEVLVNALSEEGVFVGTSSACSSRGDGGQYVLDSMGLDFSLASSSIRISMSRFTTEEDVAFLIEKLKKTVPLLKF
ncbi:cysteine desulfurase [Mesotoga sp. HF07.pep.5.2.highcov]|uniref:cysteine desulfurase family protein n=1 Tax=Mesotoga TaxID=1184396 RepID=UPI000C19A30B|nr:MULTISPECIES: cysteine desulfurase family protein [Mesotoga]PIJ62243.1 cysteine desulfurase [Mesotoga sp. H07.pep.5.3]RLL90522.1 cysteine desulfurase [Mesotoga sp. HF07.pep.5.2.highcov]HNQ69989.1 cysteine desulfurase family protein [Mesotoga prima]HNS74972.1 cysteine desulfurase family protein [Mesotoga prima]